MERRPDMSMQADQKSLGSRANEQQEQSSQRKGMARSSPGAGLLQRRGAGLFGLAAPAPLPANPFSPLRRVSAGMGPVFRGDGVWRAGGVVRWSPARDAS